MALNVSQPQLAPSYFGDPQALELDIPYYHEDQTNPLTASPLTTVGLPWANTLVGTQISPSDVTEGLPVPALNFDLTSGEPFMANPMNNVTYISPVSATMGRKLSTVSTAHSSNWSDAYAGTPRGSPCMSRKMSTISPTRSLSYSDESADSQSSSPAQIDLYVCSLLVVF